MDSNQVLKTGTTTVGIRCKDSIILAADTRATAGGMIVDKNAKKVHTINEDMAVTIAGSVSEVQMLIKLIKAELKLKEVRVGRKSTNKESASLLSGMVYGNIRKMSMFPGVAHFLVGARDKKGIDLYDIFPDGSLTLIDDYVSSGSGSIFAYGVLEALYKPQMSDEEGVKLAIKSVNAALQRDTSSGNGIAVVKITKDGIVEVLKKSLNVSLEE